MPILDRDILDKHIQIYQYSCIPSCVEIILKLCGRVPVQYYEQQMSWQNKRNGSFADYHEKNIEGLTFRHVYNNNPRCDDFPLEELFATIDEEIENGRFVAISLVSTIGWHMYVVYEIDIRGKYLAVSKYRKETIFEDSVKRKVTEMKGTDILVYRT